MDDIQRAIDYFENEIRIMKKYHISLDCVEFGNTAISAMKELRQYRQIGTLEECREAKEKLSGYEAIGLTPDQIRQIDRMYREKCEELAEYTRKG